MGLTAVPGKPVVGVIVPTHNRADLLPRALGSVYAQEGAGAEFELEVIVVDDASTDATPDVVCRYPEVRYVRLATNRGLAAARNAGIRESRGMYVGFLDDDDLWLPQKLRQQVSALEAHRDVQVVYSPYIIRTPDQKEEMSVDDNAPSGSIFHALLMENCCGSALSILTRRKTFEAIGYFDESLTAAEDYDMWLRLAFHFPFMFVPGPVAICLRARKGMYSANLREGSPGHSAHYAAKRAVLEKGLAMLPNTAVYVDIRQQARFRLEIWTATALREMREFELMRAHILAALKRCPWALHAGWERAAIERLGSSLVMASDSPIAATRVFCDQLRIAIGERGPSKWVQTRLLLAGLWADVAANLVTDRRYMAAGYAATYAILLNPLLLRRVTLGLCRRARRRLFSGLRASAVR